MKVATEKKMTELPRKVYHPPVIILLGELLIGKGDCESGGSDTEVCFNGIIATVGSCLGGASRPT